MQLLATVATFALAACGVAASPTPSWGNWGNSGNPACVSRSYIEGLIAQEIVFLEHKNVTAAVAAGNAIFDANIAEYGDSINSLRGAPVSPLFFPSPHFLAQSLTSFSSSAHKSNSTLPHTSPRLHPHHQFHKSTLSA